jgi:hypothetical protein
VAPDGISACRRLVRLRLLARMIHLPRTDATAALLETGRYRVNAASTIGGRTIAFRASAGSDPAIPMATIRSFVGPCVQVKWQLRAGVALRCLARRPVEAGSGEDAAVEAVQRRLVVVGVAAALHDVVELNSHLGHVDRCLRTAGCAAVLLPRPRPTARRPPHADHFTCDTPRGQSEPHRSRARIPAAVSDRQPASAVWIRSAVAASSSSDAGRARRKSMSLIPSIGTR